MSSLEGSALEPAPRIIEAALARARSDCIVIVEEQSDADVRFANNTTTTNGLRRDRKVTVISFDRRAEQSAVAVVSRSGLVDVGQILGRAEAEAAKSERAEDEYELVGPERNAPEFSADPEDTGLEVFADVLQELGEAFGRARKDSYKLFGFAHHAVNTVYLGSTTGLRQRHVQKTGSLELVARSADGEASTWAGVGTADFSDVSLAAMEQTLIERLSWSRRRLQLPAGRYEVLLPPDAVADLVIDLWGAMSGREAEDGGNVFSAPQGRTRIGERLTALPFELGSDPKAPGLECVPFVVAPQSGPDLSVFDNGAEAEHEQFLEDGTLRRLRYHRAGAAKSGQPFTPRIDNLSLSLPGSRASLEDLIASTDRGLLLTCLWYIREVDPATLLLTGLTRDGVYLVEHGEVIGAVNNFRFNESPLDMLAKASEVGSTKRALSREWGEWLNRTAMPSLRVADFNMSSVSAAN